MKYVIHYDVAGIIVLAAVMLHFFYKKTVNTRRTQIFTAMLLVAMAASVLDLVTLFTIQYSDVVPLTLNYIVNEAYLAVFNTMPALHFSYIIAAVNPARRETLGERAEVFALPAMTLAMILTTQLTGGVFYFDEAGNYQHGPYMIVFYAIAILYVAASMVITIRFHRRLTMLQKMAVWVYGIFSLAALALQIIFPDLMIMQFVLSIVMLLIYLSLENPEDYTDKRLGLYNSAGLQEVLTPYFHEEKPFTILGIEIEGTRYIGETLGAAAGEQLIKEFADFLLRQTRKSPMRVFFLSGTRFAVVARGQEAARLEALIDQIHRRFRDPFYISGVQVSLEAPMCLFSYPENISKLEDVQDMLTYTLTQAASAGNEAVIRPAEGALDTVKREQQVLQAMRSALRENQFEVYYQPIFSVEEQRYTSAEALLRLRTESLGFISPDEFIPLAEKNGMILELGTYVMREVCRFMTQCRLWEYGIRSMDVNLSTVQCMQKRLGEDLMEIMDEYDLDYRCIDLEITETAAVMSAESLRSNMEKLIEEGMRFSLDDYGTGFSNTSHIIKYPFQTIKLDKSMVWSSMEDTKAMCVLKHTIAMIKEMQLQIVAEGVETREQAEELAALGCDFFQGYYYSRPVPGDAFLECLQKGA